MLISLVFEIIKDRNRVPNSKPFHWKGILLATREVAFLLLIWVDLSIWLKKYMIPNSCLRKSLHFSCLGLTSHQSERCSSVWTHNLKIGL